MSLFSSNARASADGVGMIALDEHTSVPCIIHGYSESSIRMTIINAEDVPDVFVLQSHGFDGVRICTVTQRSDEVLDAYVRRA